jgi:hypothetical protein
MAVQELKVQEVLQVSGAVSQSDVISTNMTIIGIGAAAIFSGFTAPAWGPIALIGVSAAVTGSYLYDVWDSYSW